MSAPYTVNYRHGIWDTSYKAEVFANSTVVATCCHDHAGFEDALLCAMDLRLTLPETPPAPRKPITVIRVDDGNEWDLAPTYSRQQAVWEDERLEDGVLG